MDLLTLLATRPLAADVHVLSVRQPLAGLIVRGSAGHRKTIESRPWPWPFEPSWLVIHVPHRIDTEALRRFGALGEVHLEPRGVLLGMAWVARCRPLLPEDEIAAGFYKPDRYAFELEHPVPFVEQVAWTHGPRRVGKVKREVVERALALGGAS